MPTTILVDIPVLWEEPTQTTDRRLVIWLPGFTSCKEDVHAHILDLAAAGYVALTLDPVDHGARSRMPDGSEPDPATGEFVADTDGRLYRHFWSIEAETAQEIPIVVDWAVAELDVAPTVGIGGISMGGDISIVAAGLDERIAAVAACIATADWTRPGSIYPLHAPNPTVQAHFDQCNPLINLERYRHFPAMLFQCGADDETVPPDGAARFVEALAATHATLRKKLHYRVEERVGHEFTKSMWQNALAWFQAHL